MNLSTFSSQLRSGFDTLSPQLREAARWVIDHPADVALPSTREQARRAGVTPVTMTRLLLLGGVIMLHRHRRHYKPNVAIGY